MYVHTPDGTGQSLRPVVAMKRHSEHEVNEAMASINGIGTVSQ